jgi:hypothetical protein
MHLPVAATFATPAVTLAAADLQKGWGKAKTDFRK